MNDQEALLLLTGTKGIGAAFLHRLTEHGVTPSQLIESLESGRELPADLNAGRFTAPLEAARAETNPADILRRCDSLGVRVMTWTDADYPSQLKEIHDAPPVLYVKGTLLAEDRAAISIVGARHASLYGTQVAHRFAYELAEAGVTIVSGLARGIDGEAHRGALKARGRTIAVLGSGIDVIYPQDHTKLFGQIAESGCVLSEFPLGTPPLAHNFPARNRIIAGLSLGVLVVEAHSRSGSLITSSLALEAGREVYAIPGSIDSIQSRGTNTLIQQGAKLVQNSGDILEDLYFVLDGCVRSASPKVFSEEPSPRMLGRDREHERLLELFSSGPLLIDEIAAQSDLGAERAGELLSFMELQGLLRKRPGGFYELASV